MSSLYHKSWQLGILISLMPLHVLAAEISVGELSSGACWYQQTDEVIKISSFNEKKSLAITPAMIEEYNYLQITGPMRLKKDITYQGLGLSLHCGGYGASLVVKSKVGDALFCSWLSLSDEGLSVRSIGGLEDGARESSLCDGHKNLELIVGLVTKEQIHELKRDNLTSVIKSVVPISDKMVKVILDERYFGKEEEAIGELKKMMSLKYIEYNLIQHQVGESVSLK